MKRWTKEEHDKLEILVEEGKTRKEIAEALGRTYQSVASRVMAYGYDVKSGAKKTSRGLSHDKAGDYKAIQFGQWPEGMRFEDDPRACRPEPRLNMTRPNVAVFRSSMELNA
jgi:hypothetical protein|tara:strand:- start:573 stop:908 length:336 start_codon:yes stop_codon:yes gene_type:complete